MEKYTGKERIEAAFRREYVDRVPFNLDIGPHYAQQVMGVSLQEYSADLDKAFEAHSKYFEVVDSDIVTVPQNVLGWWSLSNLYRFKTKTEAVTEGVLKDKSVLADLEYIEPENCLAVSQVRESCRRTNDTFKEKASRPALPGPVWDAARLRGTQQFVLDTVEDPDFVHRLMRLTTDAVKARVSLIGEAGPTITVIADPTAGCSVMSPSAYREFILPYHKELFSYLREKIGGKTRLGLHICGYTDPIMEDVMTLDIDWFELDGEASLKKMVEVSKKRLVLRGNVGPTIFSEGTKEQIEEAVKNCIDIAAEGSAYVLSTGCQIPLTTSLENAKYFAEAAEKYGRYKRASM